MIIFKKGKIYRTFLVFVSGKRKGEITNSYIDVECDSTSGAGAIVHVYEDKSDSEEVNDNLVEGARVVLSQHHSNVIADSLDIYDKTYEPRVIYKKIDVPVEVEVEKEICVNFYAEGLIDYLYNWYCEFKGREFNEENSMKNVLKNVIVKKINNMGETGKTTPLSDLRKSDLDHYEKASSAVNHWSSGVPRAINFYYDHMEKKELEDQMDKSNGLVKFCGDHCRKNMVIYVVIAIGIFLFTLLLGSFYIIFSSTIN